MLIGTTVDALFSQAPKSKSNPVMEGLEALAELTVDGLAAGWWMDVMGRRGLGGSIDPTRGFAFLLAMLATQPRLGAKLSALASAARRAIDGVLVDFKAPPGSALASRPPTNPVIVPNSDKNAQLIAVAGGQDVALDMPNL